MSTDRKAVLQGFIRNGASPRVLETEMPSDVIVLSADPATALALGLCVEETLGVGVSSPSAPVGFAMFETVGIGISNISADLTDLLLGVSHDE